MLPLTFRLPVTFELQTTLVPALSGSAASVVLVACRFPSIVDPAMRTPVPLTVTLPATERVDQVAPVTGRDGHVPGHHRRAELLVDAPNVARRGDRHGRLLGQRRRLVGVTGVDGALARGGEPF